jgi:2'-5' RNA ligase superfamily
VESDVASDPSDDASSLATSLIIPLALDDGVVERTHRRLDPSAWTGHPTHVSVMHPFAPMSAITVSVVEQIRKCVGSHERFEATLAEVSWFGDAVMYLAPSPREPFVALTSHLWAMFPDYPPYGGVFDEIIPHMTFGQRGRPSRMRRAARRVARRLPIGVTASVVLLMAPDAEGQWSERARFPLAGGT